MSSVTEQLHAAEPGTYVGYGRGIVARKRDDGDWTVFEDDRPGLRVSSLDPSRVTFGDGDHAVGRPPAELEVVDYAPAREAGPKSGVRATPHTTEKRLQAAVMKLIREVWLGAAYHPIGTGASAAGEPDVIGCVLGRHVAIELKQPGNKPTPLQWKRLRTYRDAGSLAGWARTEAEVDALLQHVGDKQWRNPQFDV